MQRIARAGLRAPAAAAPSRAATRTSMAARGYATESDALKFSLLLPHKAIYKSSEVVQVNLSALSGDMGILTHHIPVIEPLKPGMLEIIEQSGSEPKRWFVSGGFATMHPNNTLLVNAVEAYELDSFSPEAIRSLQSEAQRVASGQGSEDEKAEANAELDVYNALATALKA